MQEEIIVKLEQGISVSRSGSEPEIYKNLLIKSPTSKHQKHYMTLKSAFIKAITNQSNNISSDSEKVEDDTSDEINAEQIVALLLINDADISNVLDAFKSILFTDNKTCFIEQDQPIQTFHYDKLSISDLERCLGEYIRVFIVASLK